jgi:hypothetical protein
MLTLRKCVIGGETAPDDYSVIEDGTRIGRIRRAAEHRSRGRADVWKWNITVHIPGPPNGQVQHHAMSEKCQLGRNGS